MPHTILLADDSVTIRRVVELAFGHPPRFDQFSMKGPYLNATDHVCGLVQRRVGPVERPPHLGRGAGPLMPHPVHQEVDCLVRRHLPQVELEREDDPGGTVLSPEQHAHSVFRRGRETHVPQAHFPVQGPALSPEGRAERPAMRVVTPRHEALQVVSRNEFMMHGGSREVDVVRPHAH